ncbi:translation initiation factor IF-2 [Candidatus Woesearchaeota archaeon]|nr:translation initiation factor IF-2 [Candidatus Woesearchaeota archaeon]
MATRKVLVTVVGHVDHGKTSLLDKIRRTAVAAAEPGAITQAIGVSIIPLETIQKICGKLMDVFQGKLTVPGLLAIDTPGHAAFISLRKRGGSLADIAILVVDINEGLMPQTLESIDILKANKVPFIVAVNKIDLLPGWSYDPTKFLLDNMNALDYTLQGVFEGKMYDLVAKFAELGFQAERFDRLQDYTKQIALVPLSAKTGQGIPELLVVLTGLAQKYLEKQLQIDESGPCKGTILEVKEEKGLGTTLDCILYNGSLKVNDVIIIGDMEQPIVTKVRALLEPEQLAEMREKKSRFRNVKEVFAATGVKIAAPGMEKAIAGMPLRSCSGKPEDIEQLKQEVQQEVGEVLVENEEGVGVMIKADTIGGLEALKMLLQEKNIPVSSASLGEITKKDLSQLETLREKDEFHAVILAFNVPIHSEIQELAKNKHLKVIVHDVIYHTIEEYQEYVAQLKKEIELRELSSLVRPCKFFIMKGYVFRQNNPAVVGVEIEIGKIRTGDPVMKAEGKRLTIVKSLEENQEAVTIAEQGKQLAMSLDGVTVGRQINEGDFLYTDIPEDDFKKLKELKKYLTPREVEVLKEIMEIKRKENAVWGMG